ncbi:Bud-site selection protein [Mycena filopes]|nr:Bud-site selection protein [Mycena filopes]
MNDDNAASTSTAPRGTKRKRPDQPAEDPTTKLAGKLARLPPNSFSPAALLIRVCVCVQHHELKEVRKAAKKARTFETQRVVKKLKGLRKKDPATPEVAVLEAELEELKTIDTDAMAATALRTRLLKDRHIADSEPAQAAIARELPPTPSTAPVATNTNSKVQARLFSHRALGAAVSEAVTGLRAVVLPPKVEGAEDALQPQLETPAGEGEGDEAEVEEAEDEEDEEDEEEEEDAAGWESGSVRAGAADSDSDAEDADGWESGSVDSDADAASPPAKKKAAPTATATKTKTPAPTKAKSAPAKKAKPAPPTTSNGTSQFLPSLAVGYIRGGSSDSGFEDDVDVDGDGGGERKNRRGQRARRAIWEKKFGRGANHKKKEAEEAAAVQVATKARWEARKARGDPDPPPAVAGRGNGGRWTESKQVADGGWGARGGGGAAGSGAGGGAGAGLAQGSGHARPKPAQWQKPAQGQGQRDKATGGKAAGADAGLHPSWAAKKAMKEKMGGTGGAIVPSQGKKIVFA